MLHHEILNWFGKDPFTAGYNLIKESKVWENWKTDELIGLKPNLVVSKKASYGATTHPEFVEGVISFLKDKGFYNLKIIEGSWVGDSTTKAFKVCGYTTLSEKYSVPLVDLQKDDSILYEATNDEYRVCNSVMDLDRLINMPVLKGHCQTLMTCALKNLKGCIPDSEKRRYHREGLHQQIADLNEIIRPDLILVDGLEGDPDFEEGGNPQEMNLFLAAVDPVLTDSYVAGLLGLKYQDVKYIQKAENLGIGSVISDETKIRYLNKGEGVTGIERTSLADHFKPYVKEHECCSACYASLIQALVQLEKENKLPKPTIYIGQGYKQQRVDGPGIGSCLKNSEDYIKGCPPAVEDILNFLRKI